MRSLLVRFVLRALAPLGVVALVFAPTAVSAAPQVPFDGEVSGTSVRLRGGPSTQYPILKVLAVREKLAVVEEKDGWFKVRLPKDAPCWIAEGFVKDRGDGVAEVAGDNVNLRPSAGDSSYPVGQISRGPVSLVRDESGKPVKENGFARIVPPESAYGWVAAEFVTAASAQAVEAGAPAAGAPRQQADPTLQDAGKPRADTPRGEEIEAFRELDKAFLDELAKPADTRNFKEIRQLYEQYAQFSADVAIKSKARDRIAAIERAEQAIKDLTEAARLKSEEARRKAAEAEAARQALLEKENAAKPVAYLTRGYIVDHGRDALVPASHALVDADGRVIFYVRWDRGDLDARWQRYVGVTGEVKSYEDWDKPVIVIEHCDEIEEDAEALTARKDAEERKAAETAKSRD